MKKIVIIGSSIHAKVLIDVIERENKYEIIGLIDSNRNIGEEVLGYKILGKDEDIKMLCIKYNIFGGIIAIGDNWRRGIVHNKIQRLHKEFVFISAIHPSSVQGKNVLIGAGTVIMAGAIINPDAKVGNFCIINTNSTLEHDCTMRDFSSLAPGAVIGGNTYIGKYTAISIGAVVSHNVNIKNNTVIGAGSLVLDGIGNNVVAFGQPANIQRSRANDEKYL